MTAQMKGVNWSSKRFFTKSKVKQEANRIYIYVKQQCIGKPIWDGPLYVKVLLVYPLTKELAKKHADRLCDDSFLLPHFVRPDVDNLAKLLLDTCTHASVWADDGRICDLYLQKRYGTVPRIVVTIEAFPDQP